MVGLGGSGEVSSAWSYDYLPDKSKAHPRMEIILSIENA
jgi:hypothetical protein